MNPSYSFQIYTTTTMLPGSWNELAKSNVFLSIPYLEVLEESAPENMTCHFIGIFEGQTLVGIALSQFLDLNKLDSFGNRDKCFKTMVRDFVFRNFASHVLFIGNNMLTGQNAFVFSKKINYEEAIKTLKIAASALKSIFKSTGKNVHLTTFKDFDEHEAKHFQTPEFADSYRFSTQPNMVLKIGADWQSEQDYINTFIKKYRDQYKRARKKAAGIEKRKLSLEEINALEDRIYELYLHVARHAPFNSFFLARNHFRVFKQNLGDSFLFYGYFEGQRLIGFSTLIKNGGTMETYFLGYDEHSQREKMLYLNMLYDMIAYSVNQGFKEIVFARTALEIKSSVGAMPVEVFGFIEHSNTILNNFVGRIFDYVEPKTVWQPRHPFKVMESQLSSAVPES